MVILCIFRIIEPTVSYIKSLALEEIGVIATEGTIRSGAWENSIKCAMSNISVVNKACPMLATVAEEGRARSDEGKLAIKEYMTIFKELSLNNESGGKQKIFLTKYTDEFRNIAKTILDEELEIFSIYE